jgi:hypothetical protein
MTTKLARHNELIEIVQIGFDHVRAVHGRVHRFAKLVRLVFDQNKGDHTNNQENKDGHTSERNGNYEPHA